MNEYIQRVEKLAVIKVRQLTKADVGSNGLGLLGNTYYCGYWQQCYTIIEIINDMVVCEWWDNTQTIHCTVLNLKRDLLVI